MRIPRHPALPQSSCVRATVIVGQPHSFGHSAVGTQRLRHVRKLLVCASALHSASVAEDYCMHRQVLKGQTPVAVAAKSALAELAEVAAAVAPVVGRAAETTAETAAAKKAAAAAETAAAVETVVGATQETPVSAGAANTEATASAAAQDPCLSQEAELHEMILQAAVGVDILQQQEEVAVSAMIAANAVAAAAAFNADLLILFHAGGAC